ncbi:hypothetical protein [Glycomyces sp. NPDC048151]
MVLWQLARDRRHRGLLSDDRNGPARTAGDPEPHDAIAYLAPD